MAEVGVLEQIADHLADIVDELRIFNQFLADVDERTDSQSHYQKRKAELKAKKADKPSNKELKARSAGGRAK